jgi:flagellum-specific peptidoglycan hydrolase FlgJ
MYGIATYNASKKFLKQYGLGVMEAIRGTGLFFPAVMAQSALESGYGKRIPEGSNNFAGIKYNPNLPGVVGYVLSDTTEYKPNGAAYKTVQKFSKFKDVESGFRAHIKVVLGDRYKDARLNATSPEQQILMIAKAGYTTGNPVEYLNSMKGIIEAMRDISQLGRIGN